MIGDIVLAIKNGGSRISLAFITMYAMLDMVAHTINALSVEGLRITKESGNK